MIYNPHPYQAFSTQHIIKHPSSGLFLDMGLGKTVSTLTAVDLLINDFLEVEKVLVIAPKKVTESVWIDEINKWDHLKGLTISLVIGTEAQRIKALREKANIYCISRDNIAWLISFYKTAFPYDMVVIDELSSFKNHKSQRFKALKQVMPKVSRVVGLTGTPRPNGLLDLWPQLYLLDQGERLGKNITKYREQYFVPDKRNEYTDYKKYNLKGVEQMDASSVDILGDNFYEKLIYDKIADICVSMKSEDYLDLPELILTDVHVKLSDKTRKIYDEFEKSKVLELAEEDGSISAINAAALSGKLRQFANGAVYYGEEKDYQVFHDEKLDALEEIVESANGKPVLVFYEFRHDLERIKAKLKAYKPVELKTKQDMENWNAGKIQIMICHPASAGHGLNLQFGGNIMVFFGLPWSLELYQQAIKRIHRQGVKSIVQLFRLIAVGTMDENVAASLADKDAGQEGLMRALKARVQKIWKSL